MYSMQYYGQWVHGQLSEDFDADFHESLADDGDEYFDSCLIPILDENGDVIPLSKCICGAHTPFECGCACDSWGNLEDYEDY